MKFISKGRRQGKTYDMIKLASENKGYILCSTFQQAQHIYDLSKDMGLSIHFPITYSDLPLTKEQMNDGEWLNGSNWMEYRKPYCRF